MYIRQGDLFQGLSMDFLKRIMAATQRESHPEGAVLFRENTLATHLYVIIQGAIECCVNDMTRQAHVSSNMGESFGWAKLAGRDVYTATARCLAPSDVLKIDVETLQGLLETHLEQGYVFYKNLACILGKRLTTCQTASEAPCGCTA